MFICKKKAPKIGAKVGARTIKTKNKNLKLT